MIAKHRGTRPTVDNDGNVALSRRVVAAPMDEEEEEELLLKIVCVVDGDLMAESNVELALGRHVTERRCRVGFYELQVKVAWSGNLGRR